MYFASIDYVHDLMNEGEVKKAHAFWEYCYRMEFQLPCVSYANNWNVSESVANKWISEFFAAINNEIQESKARVNRHTNGLRKR